MERIMWPDRFARIGKQLMVAVTSQSGHTELLPAEHIYKFSFAKLNSEKISFVTSFNEWTRATAREYAAGVGIDAVVTENHEVYAVDANDTRVLIPAWELQRALLGFPTIVASCVFVPSGLERVCAPIFDEKKFRIVSTIYRKGCNKTIKSPQFLNRLEWFYSHPSAYRAWNSIYRFARSGKIAVEHPAATMTISAHGRYIDGTFYASSLDIQELSPQEAPMEWARSVSSRYDFADRFNMRRAALQTKDTRIRPIGDRWELTDLEWSAIQDIVARKRRSDRPGRPSEYALRDVVNGILVKMGTGNAWHECGHHRMHLDASRGLYRRLKADGRWDQIAKVLKKTRARG